MKELRQTSDYAKYMQAIGWEVDKLDGTFCYSRKIPVLGSIAKIQRAGKAIAYEKIKKVIKERRAFVVYVEPENDEEFTFYKENYHFSQIKSPLLPSTSIQIDLTKSEESLLKKMHYKTRYNTKLAQRKNVELKISNDIDAFAEFWRRCARKRGMYFSLRKEIISIYEAFGENAAILFGVKKKELLGGVMLISTGKISYYMYAAASDLGKKLFVPTFLAWEAIKFSKRKKNLLFDFEGIYDERFPLNSWKGFSRFKIGFGGREVKYPPSLRRFYLPF